MAITFKKQATGTVSNPAATHMSLYVNDTGQTVVKDSTGTDTVLATLDDLTVDVSVLEHVYISDVNGDDNNSGADGNNPIATIGSYFARYTEPPKTGRVFHFDSYDSVDHVIPTLPKGWGQYAPILFVGDGADQPGDDGKFEERAAENALGGTNTAQIVTSGLATSFEIKYVEILSGSAVGAIRQIHQVVTGDTIILNHSITGLTAGDSFRVFTPNVWLDMSAITGAVADSVGSFSAGVNPPPPVFLGLINVALDMSITGTFDNCHMVTFGAVWDTNYGEAEGMRPNNSTLQMGYAPDANWVADIAPAIAACNSNYPQNAADLAALWNGYGLTYLDGGYTVSMGGGTLIGYFSMPEDGVLCVGTATDDYPEDKDLTAPGYAYLTAPHCSLWAGRGGSIIVAGGGNDAPPYVSNTYDSCIVAENGGIISIKSSGAGTYSAEEDCVIAKVGGQVYLYNGVYTSASGRGGRTHAGQILLEFSVNITGSLPGTDDFTVDNGANDNSRTDLNGPQFLSFGAGVIQLLSAGA